MLDLIKEMFDKKIFIKISGEKLKIKNGDELINIDLESYPLLKVNLKDKQVVLSCEADEEIALISLDNNEEARNVYDNLSKKLIKKNKRFRNTVFILKTALIVFLVFMLIKMYVTYSTVRQAMQYQEQQQQEEAMQNYAIDSNKLDNAKGQAVSVEEVIY